MARNLVVCLDGTNDQFDTTNSNVVKLYRMLRRDTPQQITYYQTGIGTVAPLGLFGKTFRHLKKILDSAVASFIGYHVRSAYRFLMQYYQNGDSIYIFGFSRGAYSARVLAGMLHKVGLLSTGNEELVRFAWRMFKKPRNDELAREFSATFSRSVTVHFLGLWDTVSSVGWIWNPKHFPYTATNQSVTTVRHAVSLDERRAEFVQNLWRPIAGQDLKEVWFPGVHCDIGGGYAETEAGLSKITLEWMVDEAVAHGLQIDSAIRATLLPATDTATACTPNPLAIMHQSLRGPWWLAEIVPKRIHDPKRNYQRRWMVHLGRPRYVHPGAEIHPAVDERQKKDQAYNPPNLPPGTTAQRFCWWRRPPAM